jgi:hypothetical protein
MVVSSPRETKRFISGAKPIIVMATQNTDRDLYRGMQGAGHNFGIVTSFELKIYPKKLDTWHYHNYIFTQEKLEPFFEALNTFHNNGSTPVLMALNMGGFAMDPSISEKEVCVPFHSPRLLVFSYMC